MNDPVDEQSSHRTSAEALEEAEERFRAAFDHAPIGMALVGIDGRHLRVNPALCAITGYSERELLARTWQEITHPEDLPYDLEYVRRVLDGELASYTHEKRYVHARGEEVWARLNASLLRDVRGRPLHFIAQIEEITERKIVEERLLNQILHDPLTSLHSRVLFMDRLMHALARSQRLRTPVAVLFVDLDHFKDINDRFGHRAGDEMLVSVARKLERAVRPSDTVARIGGDEFVVLCEDMSSERDAVLVAQRLSEALSLPVAFGDAKMSITASIGIAFAQGGDDPDSLLKNADAAMYKVKEGGRGTYEIYLDAIQTGSSRVRTNDQDSGEEKRGREMMGEHDEHPAAPEQVESGFEEGQERGRPGHEHEEEHEGRFSEGQETRPEGEEAHRRRRFSEGEEDLPESPEKTVERRFSEGQEGETPPQ
jgi:diguanylate cyclase (GGDEF)-like protein/PAS domain S-box-containing protein